MDISHQVLFDEIRIFSFKGLYSLTLIPAWKYNYIHCIMLGEIIYPLPNHNGATVEVLSID